MHTLWIALRAGFWATLFLGLWGWLAYEAHLRDGALGLYLPAWTGPLGVALMAVGAALVVACLATFVVIGRGTPAPFDAPRKFVAVGPYRWVRNPMYLGAATMFAGYALCAGSVAALAVPLALLLAAHVFVLLYEEPALERRFGESYRDYKRATNRWLPRF